MQPENLRLLLEESIYAESKIYPLLFDQGARQAFYLRQGDKSQNSEFLNHWDTLRNRLEPINFYPVLVPEPDFVINFPATKSFCQRLSDHFFPEKFTQKDQGDSEPEPEYSQFQHLVEVVSQGNISLVQVNKWLRRLYPEIFIPLSEHADLEKILDEQLAYTYNRCHITPKREDLLESIKQGKIKHRFHLEYYLLRWEAGYTETGHEIPSLDLPAFNVSVLASQQRLGQNVLLLPKGSGWGDMADIYRYLLNTPLELPEALVLRGIQSQFTTKLIAAPFSNKGNMLLFPQYKPQKLKYAFVIATFFETIYGESYGKKGILVRELARQWFSAPVWMIGR